MAATNLTDAKSPSNSEASLAHESHHILAAYVGRDLAFHIAETGEQVVLPAAAVDLLVGALSEMASGNAVTLMPMDAELSTQKAADLMGVSRPFLIKELDEGRIPYRKVGAHRRVLVRDLVDYKQRIDAQRGATLRELAAQAQELSMGY